MPDFFEQLLAEAEKQKLQHEKRKCMTNLFININLLMIATSVLWYIFGCLDKVLKFSDSVVILVISFLLYVVLACVTIFSEMKYDQKKVIKRVIAFMVSASFLLSFNRELPSIKLLILKFLLSFITFLFTMLINKYAEKYNILLTIIFMFVIGISCFLAGCDIWYLLKVEWIIFVSLSVFYVINKLVLDEKTDLYYLQRRCNSMLKTLYITALLFYF
mgnify:CR=1 FL=1